VTNDAPAPDQAPAPAIDSTVPQTARIWNYWLGGKDNYAVDRQVGDEILAVMPDLIEIARGSRAFLARAVRFLAGEAGIRQFMDLGTGLPTANNTHEVAQSVAPECRVVYVDNDPLVLVHARALLTSSPEGATDYIDADARDTDTVLAQARRTLDFTRPIAVMMLGILGHVVDDGEARTLAARVVGALPAGSYLTILDGTDVIRSEEHLEAQRIWNESAKPPYQLRKPAQIAGFFEGLELVEPGVVSAPRWRPEPDPSGPPAELDAFCGVARKPAGR
jgi:O-methyltransferase involved in polyketide biosynthesis